MLAEAVRKMIKKILIKGDAHLHAGFEAVEAYKLVKKFAKDWKPDLVVDLGDLLDLPYIVSFNKENLKVLTHTTFRKDFDLANRDLDFWQGITDQYVQIEGNHDERIGRFLERSPIWEGWLEYEDSLHLKAREIPFYRQIDQPYRLGKLIFIHGYWYNKYAANRHLEAYGHNVVFGHTHRFHNAAKVYPLIGEEIMAWGLGCLTDVQPEWMKGKPTGWQKGFAIVYLETNTGKFNLYPINIIENRFVFEGRIYK